MLQCIMGLVIKAQNRWHDVGRPLRCDALQLPPFIHRQLAPLHTVLDIA